MTFSAFLVAFEALRSNPLRTILSTLGVVIGSAALVAVLSVGDGLERYARTAIERQGFTTISINARSGERIDGVMVPASEQLRLTAADIDSVRPLVPASAQFTMMANTQRLQVLSEGSAPRGLFIIGIGGSRFPVALANELEHGRVPTSDELLAGAPVVVVNDTLARVVSKGDALAAVGRTFPIGDRTVEIVGVLKASLIPFLQVVAPMSIVEAAAPDATALRPRLDVTVMEASEVDSTRASLTAYAKARPDWNDKVTVAATGADNLASLEEGMLVFKLAMGAFASISLIVGGIGIMNVLLAAVAERTREIGIRKATGARHRDILVQFLAESVAITSFGSVMGVVVGFGGASLVTFIMRRQTEAKIYAAFTLETAVVCALIAVIIGVVFGMVPALRAARLSPIDAIRHE
jgi:putative ABC transport system permease protein